MVRTCSLALALCTTMACGSSRSSFSPDSGSRDGSSDRVDAAPAIDALPVDALDTLGDRSLADGEREAAAADTTSEPGGDARGSDATDVAGDAPSESANDGALESVAEASTDVPSSTQDGTQGGDGRGDGAGDAWLSPDAGTSLDAGLPVLRSWPGSDTVAVVDEESFFGPDLSGLVYQPGATPADDTLWAVDNGTSLLFDLAWDGSLFAPRTTMGWKSGKALQYPSASGSPDAEGLTMAEWKDAAIYVSAERSNDAKSTSRMSVLRYDLSGTSSVLVATHEWNLTPDLPASDPNRGLEGLAWIPDSYLVARGFVDETTGQAYVPRSDDGHGTGLFFAGLESNGFIYAYALDHGRGTFRRVATIASGQAAVIDLTFDRDVGTLWSYCDDTCGNRATLLDIDRDSASPTRGHFVVRAVLDHPTGLPNAGNEGISLAPESECAQGKKAFIWSDDSNVEGHALRRGDVPCGLLY